MVTGWARGITQIVWVPDLGATPARVNRRTGVMQCSVRLMSQMSADHRLFVMLHEMAHVVLQTTNEMEADAWAFKEYARRGHSLNASVKALTQVLNDKNPEHHWRMYLQLQRAKRYDYTVNGNTKIYNNAKSINRSIDASGLQQAQAPAPGRTNKPAGVQPEKSRCKCGTTSGYCGCRERQ